MKGDFQLGHTAFYPHAITDRFPRASKAFLVANGLAPAPLVERSPSPRPLAKETPQEPNPGRVLVRVTSFRRRLLDEDNLCEKYHVDCCRYAGLLSSDAPERTKIEVAQVKVKSKEEERTEIQITYP